MTSAVLTEGLNLKMAPIRTSAPIPKAKISEAMREIKKIKIKTPFKSGDIIIENFLNLGANLVATRDIFRVKKGDI